MRKHLYFVMLFCVLLHPLYAQIQNTALLTQGDLEQVSQLAGLDLLQSNFLESQGKKVFMLSDFNNISDFNADMPFMARLFLATLKENKNFILSGAIASNAFNADPMLDKIRQMRNNKEFADSIPKGSLVTPQYSISVRLSSNTRLQKDTYIIEYHFIFTLLDLKSGLVEWDFTHNITKLSKELPSESLESQYGIACKNAQSMGDTHLKEVCEIAISELWEGNVQDIAESRRGLMLSYAQKAVKLESAFGYRALASLYRFGVGVRQDMQKALQLYAKACESNDSASCYNLALMAQNAQGMKQDLTQAKVYAGKACDLQMNAGCRLLESLKKAKAVEKLDERVLELQEQCEKNIPSACNDLSFSYYHGLNGVAKNDAIAVEFMQKACKLGGIGGCYQLGLWYSGGYGGLQKSNQKAIEHFVKSCDDLQVKEACKDSTLTQCQSNEQNYKSVACQTIGAFYEQGGTDLPQNTSKALKYYQKACDMGLELACRNFESLKAKTQ